MTLRRKMSVQIMATIAGLLLTIGASIWGLNGLRQDYGLALTGYADLRQVFAAGSHLATARTLLIPPANRRRALSEVQTAAEMFQIVGAENDGSAPLPLSHLAAVDSALQIALAQLASPPDHSEADAEAISRALGRVGDLAAEIREQIQTSQVAARDKRRATVAAMGGVSIIAVLGAVLLGIWEYRGVIGPIARLNMGVRRVARGRFAQRVEVRGNDEIASLAADFNRMAEELDGFYQELERKVAQASRDLVRSERLASVGYLAAGVAHEINNPLGIISGYAEMSLEQLKEPRPGSDPELAKALQVICDEAFRCKEIIAKLLSLSQGGEDQRVEVDLVNVAREVIAMAGGLRDYRGRQVDLRVDGAKILTVRASDVEMKQVVLNLLINALQSSSGEGGRVQVELDYQENQVRLAVVDFGKGMTPETAQRVFEPFFTERNGSPHRGTGLGLTISHAIIESHGGRIYAQSEGPGKGSRFVFELPAASAEGSA